MRCNKVARIFVKGCLVASLVTTSFGGALVSNALAATPKVAQSSIAIAPASSGSVAVGLIAALSHHGGSGNSSSLAVMPQPDSAAAQSQAAAYSGLTAEEQRAFDLLNADRAQNGLPALQINSSLTTLAKKYGQDMINRNYFAHNNPEGQSPFDRMTQAGVSYSYAGENLAINTSVDSAERAFMNSPGHRANILSPNYSQVGVGVAHSSNGSVYVVQEFIKP